MKKNKLIKSLSSILLILIMILQLPIISVKADESTDNTINSVESDDSYKIDKDIASLKIYKTTLSSTTTINNTAAGYYYKTPIVWEVEDESLLKIEPYSDTMVKFIPNSHLNNDTKVKATATMTLGTEVRQKEFEFTIVGSRSLKSLYIPELDEEIDLTNDIINYPIKDDLNELTITPVLESNNENLKITINGQEVNSEESYKYTDIDHSLFNNRISIKVDRADIKNISKTYVINLSKPATELPDYSAYWGSAKQDITNNNTVDAYTPRSVNEVDSEKSWFINLREGKTGWGKWSYPIVVNKYIYIAADTTLFKYDLNGNLINQTTLDGTVLGGGYTGWLAYGDGMIFVPLGNGAIQAFNANDLSPLWKSNSMGIYAQTSCPLLYKDEYLYTGVTNGSNKGVYGCIKTSDDDKTTGYEIKDPIWVFNDNNTDPSFYWAGATIIDNYLVVPCDTGKVYSIDINESINNEEAVIVDTFEAIERIRVSICYDEESNTIYFPTGNTNHLLYSVNFDNKTGKFGTSKTAELGGSCNCTPIVYKDRLYISSPTGIHVFNKNTLEQIYLAESTDMGVGKQNIRHLSLSTAYSKESNNYEVYLYGYNYSTPGYVSVLKDNQTSTDGTIELLHTNTESPQYSTSNIVIADDGSLLYVNDSARLFCLKSTVKEQITINNFKSSIDSPQKIGTKIKFGVSATGKDLKYKFIITKDGKSVYSTGYKSTNYINWTPKSEGNYTVICKIKDAYNNEVTKSLKYIINADDLEITSIKASPINSETIKLGTAAKGKSNLLYRFVVIKDGKNVYTRAYKKNNTCKWTPKESGTYTIYFKVKDSTGKEVLKTKTYTI